MFTVPWWNTRCKGDMKLLVLIGCIAFAVAHRNYNIYGGYKEGGKYVYYYEAFLNPAKVPNLETQLAKLHINGTVELHIKPSGKAILQVTDMNMYECLSDPKNMSGVNERLSEFSSRLSRPLLKKPLKFVYIDGLVRQVFAEADDPEGSVNVKKGILNMLQVDVLGKDRETGLKDFFTKEEAAILGICQTSYSHKYFEVFDARNVKKRIGMNITKTIDFENCTNIDHDIYNSVIQGRNPDQDSNPLKATATIKFNITGTERNFKIESATAQGVYVLFPFSKQEEGIPTESLQRLVLLREGTSRFEEDHPNAFDAVTERGKLIMQMPSFHKPEIIPSMSLEDQERKALFIRDAIKKFSSLLPSGTPVQSVVLLPETSTIFMQIVNNLRQCDIEMLNKIWEKCDDTNCREWLIYALSLCHTEACLESMRMKIQLVEDKDILTFLQGVGFAGQPTRNMVNMMEKFCESERIVGSPKLTKACWISSSNIAKGFCKVNSICSSWVETVVMQALKKISQPECYQNIKLCQPIPNVDVQLVMSIAENLGRPSFLAPLEDIIFHTELPTSVKMHAISCCRPLTRLSPKRTQILMTKLFRDFKYDIEMRTLALQVIMENPHPHLIQLCARQIYVEPSLNIRKFAYELFFHCSQSATNYNRAIRNTCKSVLKLYKKLYLPSPLAPERSMHFIGQLKNPRWNIAAEVEGCWIANNRSYLPRFQQKLLRASVLGRKFEVFDSKMYMQGIQDYMNWWMYSIKQYFQDESPTKELLDIQKKIFNLDELTSHVPKQPEDLLYEGTFKLFDKLVSVHSFEMNETSNIMEQIMDNLPLIANTFTELKAGKNWSWTQPFMPVDVIYRVPSLAGIPLVFNMSSVLMPYARTTVQLKTKPDIKTPFQLFKTKLEEVEISGTQQFSSLAEVRGTVKFLLPFIEVGAQCRKVMNVSTHIEGFMRYNMITGAYNEDIKLPKDLREVMYFTTETYHYIKTSKEALRKVVVEPDQLGKVQIINVTRPCDGHCRSEEWIIRSASGKYLSVQDGKVVLKRQPLAFKVIFHGVNRRIISLYVPNQGYVVMSRKQPCLYVKQTGYGKYFIVDFNNLESTFIKSLVHMNSVPESWGTPTSEELDELKRINSLLMKEEVVLSGEEYIESELIDPSQQLVRVVYLALTQAPKVCLSPKRSQALNFTIQRRTNFTTLLTRYSYSNGTCIGKPWGLDLCLHGYYPVNIAASPMRLLYTPSEFRATCGPANNTRATSISSEMKFIKNTTAEFTYRILTRLTGTPKTVLIDINWQKEDHKLKIRVTPSDPMLLRMKKICYDEHFKPDNYSLRISVDDKECKIVHVKADLLAPKNLPRYQMAFRYNYTTEGVPSFWRQSIWYLDFFVLRPLLRYSSDYWYANATAFNNMTQWNLNATFNGTAYMEYCLTSNDTLSYKFITPSETWVWEKVKLNSFTDTLPKGSRPPPVVYKLYWSEGKARCHHRNTTFVTFDKKVYNYTIPRGCDQILLRSCYENMTQFMVLTRTKGGPKNSLRRIVTTLIDEYSVTFTPQKNYSRQPTVEINERQITLENNVHTVYKSGEVQLIISWEPEVKTISLWHRGTKLWVALTRSTLVRTSIGTVFYGKVCGMCGNFNGEQRFEFRTPEGKLIRDIRQPKLYDPELRLYEERHFGNSWFVPSSKCARGECSFTRQLVKVDYQNKYCLTRIKVPRCQSKCLATAHEELKTPIVCVARNESYRLNGQLTSGKPITLFTATDHLVPVRLPIKCNCPCKNRYKSFKEDEDEDDFDESYETEDSMDGNEGFKKDDYWYDYFGLF